MWKRSQERSHGRVIGRCRTTTDLTETPGSQWTGDALPDWFGPLRAARYARTGRSSAARRRTRWTVGWLPPSAHASGWAIAEDCQGIRSHACKIGASECIVPGQTCWRRRTMVAQVWIDAESATLGTWPAFWSWCNAFGTPCHSDVGTGRAGGSASPSRTVGWVLLP